MAPNGEDTGMLLTEEERQRYARQMFLEDWGEDKQQRLKESTVFVAGAGGLGSPVCIYLAVAGVGHLRICDGDSPELTNFNRQILHDAGRIGTNKAVSAKMTLERLNPHVEVTALAEMITRENVDALVAGAALIVDCTDNFPARYALNEAAVRGGIPFIFGAIWGTEGMLSFFHPPATPCLACVFPEAPSREESPVLGATAGAVGCLQALEALKYLSGTGKNLRGKLLLWDGGAMDFRTIALPKEPACSVCGT